MVIDNLLESPANLTYRREETAAISCQYLDHSQQHVFCLGRVSSLHPLQLGGEIPFQPLEGNCRYVSELAAVGLHEALVICVRV